MNYEQARFNMIEQQIRPWEVLDNEILSLLAIIKREDFVPLGHRALAFVDMEIPLTTDLQAHPERCMLSPKVEARMLQDLAVHKRDTVLEIGTGSGYMAALLGHRGQHVTTVEIDPALAASARINLQRAGIVNAEVIVADGSHPLPTTRPLAASFDVIVLSGSVAAVHHRRERTNDARHTGHARGRRRLAHHTGLGHRGTAAALFSRAFQIRILMARRP